MKSILAESLPRDITIAGRRYRLRPTVWHVVKAQDALQDDRLTLDDRMRLAVWHLFRFPRPLRKDWTDALKAVFALLDEPSPYRPEKKPPTLSVQQDAALIVAAFRQLYGIDLPKAAYSMHWLEFQALMGGITGDTVLGGIMDIRGAKLPKRTAYNGEYIREMQKLKAIYALHDTGRKQSFEDGLRGMVEILAAMCE